MMHQWCKIFKMTKYITIYKSHFSYTEIQSKLKPFQYENDIMWLYGISHTYQWFP